MFERVVFGPRFASMQRAVSYLEPASARGTVQDVLTHAHYSLAELAEAIVFYDSVYVLGQASHLAMLVQRIGPETVLHLLEANCIKLRFSRGAGSFLVHDGDTLEFQLPSSLTPADSSASVGTLEKYLRAESDRSLVSKICAHVDRDNSDLAVGARATAYDKLRYQSSNDLGLVHGIVSAIVGHDTPGAPLDEVVTFTMSPGQEHYIRIDGKMNFRAPTIIAQSEMIAPLGSVSVFHRILEVLDELSIGIAIEGEYSSDPVISASLVRVVNSVVQKPQAGARISRFLDRRFGNGRAIGDAIIRNHKTFGDLLELVQKKRRFSDWLKKQEPTADLFDEYMADLEKESWIDRLPTKMVRFLVFAGGGLAADAAVTVATGIPGMGTAAGVALGAFDTFAIEKLAHGWRPNQFVSGPLKNFVE